MLIFFGGPMFKVANIKIRIEDEQDEVIKKIICKKMSISPLEIKQVEIIKKAIDARKKDQIVFNYTVHVDVKNQKKVKVGNDVQKVIVKKFNLPNKIENVQSPIIVGFGPAGLMASLALSLQGYKPIVFERGSAVEKRITDIDNFWNHGILNEESNVQFGEGGAGTFSDGKLTARSKDEKAIWMLEQLVEAGAPQEILYDAHPHIGTDVLRSVVVNLRNKIISLGGQVHFDTKVESLIIEENTCKGVVVNNKEVRSDAVILAVGHSSHDTFINLHQQQVAMEAKPFAIGVRVEHLQSFVDSCQYGSFKGHKDLKSAEYRMVHTSSSGRGVYTFCMCPGGYVVASSSSKDSVVTNGMSEYSRNQNNANAAILVQVSPVDFGQHPLDGMYYQQNLEKRAFLMGGSDYKAPVQRVVDFIANKESTMLGKVIPSYSIGTKLANLQELFSPEIALSLKEGLEGFERQMPGYCSEDAILTAVETRSSSPLRMNRDETFQSVNIKSLYPCGEGAGYAGGIVSAGVDGIRCAIAISTNLGK